MLIPRRISLVSRIVITAMSTMIAGFLAILAFVQLISSRAVYREIDARVKVALNTLRYLTGSQGAAAIVDGRLAFGPLTIVDNAILDQAKAINGADVTIFQILEGRPMRIVTTIMKASGLERNVGTELDGPARKAFDAGRNYAGVSPVAGRNFITSYELIRDSNGSVVGLLYAGFPLTTMYSAQASIMRVVTASSLCALVICVGVMWLVSQPLRRAFKDAVTVAQGLAHGDVSQQTGQISLDEVGDLNAAFREMIGYQQHMAAVADAIADGDLTVQIAPVASTDRLGIAFSRMLVNLRAVVDQLGSQALTDGLTQIGNLRAYQEAIRIEISRAARYHHTVSLALVDIDKFKEVNDAYGHQYGDMVLVRIAALLRTLRVQDCAYRIGGDEFAIILPTTNMHEAKLALERIRSEAQDQLSHATLSIGIATSDGEVDAASLQRQADIALYSGKRDGRNSVVAFTGQEKLLPIVPPLGSSDSALG